MKKQTCFRLSPEDMNVLDVIKERMGMESRSAALRCAIRWYKRTQLDKGAKTHFVAGPRASRALCGQWCTALTMTAMDVAEVTCQRCKKRLEKLS